MTSSPMATNPVARWLADETGRARPPDLALFRSKSLLLMSVFVVIPLVVVIAVLVTLKRPDPAAHVALPLACWLAATLGWAISVRSVVRVRPGGLVIDNVLVRHVIPWERFAGVYVEAGMGMFARVDDGRVVKSGAFGRSLGDALQGYSRMRATLERVREECRRARQAHSAVDPPPSYQRQLHVPWAVSLGFLAVFEAVSWIAFAAHGG
jgi:hypothetical protein